VPALVIATGTGIIVTRAATDSRLAAEVATQMLSQPRAVLLVMLALLGLAFLPGMPAVAVLGLATVALAIYLAARRREGNAAAEEKAKAGAAEGDSADLYAMLSVEPIELAVGQSLIPLVGAGGGFTERVVAFRKQFALDMGAVFPRVRVKDEKKLGPNRYEVRIFGTRVADGEVIADRSLAINPGGSRSRLEGIEGRDPTYGLPAFWILDAVKPRAREAGYTVVDPLTVLVTHFTEVVRQQAPNLLTRAETERLIGRVREQQPGLVQDLVPKMLSLGEVQKVLQNLLREKVPIRNMDAILEVLADHGAKVKETESLTELARERLGGTICQSLASPAGELYVLTLDPAIEQQMLASIRSIDERAALAIEPRLAEQLLRKRAGTCAASPSA
jgi:flagellar biosynthesis protein FlhA